MWLRCTHDLLGNQIAEKVRWDSKWEVICLLTWLSKTLERQGGIDMSVTYSADSKAILPKWIKQPNGSTVQWFYCKLGEAVEKECHLQNI